jgi:hypothetical protein
LKTNNSIPIIEIAENLFIFFIICILLLELVPCILS